MLDTIDFKPLELDGAIIGYLGLAPQKQLHDVNQLQFAKEQKLNFTLIALAMVLFAALFTLPIANRMVRPIETLAAATRELTAGRYGTRATVTSKDELGQLARDFNALASSLEQNEEARKQWVADISHELRTPLAVLRGEIEAMQDKVREVTPQSLEMLHDEVMQHNRLISDLYELSMSDLGALTYKKELIKPVEVLEKSIELYGGRLEASGLMLDIINTISVDVRLLADHKRLHQLFSNLIENSLRYTDAGGRLEIRTRIEAGQLIVHLQDTAPGVPEAELPRLFDRLYRVEDSRNRSAGGAGLGLSICKNIVAAHGGTIEAKQSPLGGLWLQISLPLQG
jgi:two-component system sensor histidine kinase BaeS